MRSEDRDSQDQAPSTGASRPARARCSPRPPAPRVVFRDESLRARQRRIALLTIFGPALGVGLALWIALERGFGRLDLAFLLGGIGVTQMCLELGYHRLFAHRAFETHRWVRRLLAVGASMAGQGRLTHWTANHRRHHLHSDTAKDPHSPHVRSAPDGVSAQPLGLVRGLIHAHWGHMLTDGVPNCTLFARDLNLDPDLRRINENYALLLWLGLSLPALLGLLVSGDAWGAASGFLWGGLVRMFVVQNVTWSAASASHRFGSRPFESGDQSRNFLWTALLSCGSGYQNNHHAFPRSAYLGLHWWEPDFGGWVIRAMGWCGLAWNIQRPSAEQIRARRRPRAQAS